MSVTHDPQRGGRQAFINAMGALDQLAPKFTVKARVIRSAIALETAGVGEELVRTFAHIVSRGHIGPGDLEDLEKLGVRDYTKGKPWHVAEAASLWVLTIDGEEVNSLATDYGTFAHMAAARSGVQEISVSDPAITDGHQVWPGEGK